MQNHKAKLKKILIFLVKVFVTLLIFWLLFSRVDFGAFIQEIRKINIGVFILALAAMTLAWVGVTWRWQEILKIFGIQSGITRLFLYNLASLFYSTVLPAGKLGGDVIKAYQVARDHGGEGALKYRASLTVFIDRVFGLLSLVLLASFYFIAGHPAIYFTGRPALAGLVAVSAALLGCLFIFTPLFDWVLKPFPSFILEAVRALRVNKRRLWQTLFLSVVVSFSAALPVYIISRGLGAGIDYLTLVFFYSVAVVLTLLPVTVAGIGLREGGLVYLLAQAGVAEETALAVSILNLATMIILAIGGGLIEFHYHFLRDNTNLRINANDANKKQ